MPSPRTSSTARGQVVTDLEGRRYTLARLIGQGGQGEVFEVKEGRLAVKLLRSTSETERQRIRCCIQAVKRLDLDGIPIASPIAVLRPPHVGYLMQLAAGMDSLRGMMNPPSDGRSISKWYLATGGLRVRLRRIATVFEVFTRLHGRGLVYGDPSPQNILFASDGEHPRAFLIDADNLHVQGRPNTSAVFTPGYGAPELICGGTGPDTLTDAFALSVIAFELLTLVHPFVGDLIHDGEPELEEAAFSGQMPWIEHDSDPRNRCSRGFLGNLWSLQRQRNFSGACSKTDFTIVSFGPAWANGLAFSARQRTLLSPVLAAPPHTTLPNHARAHGAAPLDQTCAWPHSIFGTLKFPPPLAANLVVSSLPLPAQDARWPPSFSPPKRPFRFCAAMFTAMSRLT